jgi:putative SOS response-associated peptidase YedK
MCTKAVSVNVRAMSEKLQVPIITPVSGFRAGASSPDDKDDVLPTDLAPVITHHRPREIQYMRWGLVPDFIRNPKEIKSPMLNARAETLTELPSFRDLLMASRCLIINQWFYENEQQGDEKITWKVSPTQDEYFYKAGLWTTWRNRESDEIIESFTMITCDPANSSFGKIHDRMPIIMNKEQRRLWMSAKATKEQLMALLKPCDEDMFMVTEDSRKPLKEKKTKRSDKDFLI